MEFVFEDETKKEEEKKPVKRPLVGRGLPRNDEWVLKSAVLALVPTDDQQ